MPPRRVRKETETDRERINRLVMKVEVYLNYNLFRQARAAVSELLEVDPDNYRGHEFALQIAEADGEPDEVLVELVKLAKLTPDPRVANGFLRRARQKSDDAEIRDAAVAIGLELDGLLRVPGSAAFDPVPEAWPFVADRLCARSAVVRRLTNPDELRVVETQPEADETMQSLSVALLKAALSVPTGGRRTVMFVDGDLSYVVFVSGPFAAVHEYTNSTLGRVAGRLHQLTFEEEHP